MLGLALNGGGLAGQGDRPARIIGYVPDGRLISERRAGDPFALDREVAVDAVGDAAGDAMGGRATVSRPIPAAEPAPVPAPVPPPPTAAPERMAAFAPERMVAPEPERPAMARPAPRYEAIAPRPERSALATRPSVDPTLDELRRQARAAILAARVPGGVDRPPTSPTLDERRMQARAAVLAARAPGFIAPPRPLSSSVDMPATIGVMASHITTDERAIRAMRQDATDSVRAIRLR